MLYDFIIINKKDKTPLYRQIYMSVRKSIETGSLKKGTKLPSIRRLSADLDVSKTTINGAYEQLCAEGYISNKPQSGYYVEAQFSNTPSKTDKMSSATNKTKKYYEYDFSSKSIDDGIININEWKKYVKEVLNQNYLLTSYGEEQGEEILRNALQKYSLGTRSVNTSYENIIVGAGTQTLLHILCSLLGNNKKIALADYSYIQSEYVFNSHGYDIKYFRCDKYGACIDSLEEINPDIILLNPNFTINSNITMPVTRRLEIIKWAKENNVLIIEDDYNGELRYSTHPMPCVQNYDTENTVYLGSFSKILLPSVRISYMVLPQRLTEEYNKIKKYTNQTASKTEQIALAKYINNGKLDVHLRKARRIYLEKSKLMLSNIKKYFGPSVEIVFNETSLYVSLIFKNKKIDDSIIKRIDDSSFKIMQYTKAENMITLSFSGIKNEKIESGIKLLSEIFKRNN